MDTNDRQPKKSTDADSKRSFGEQVNRGAGAAFLICAVGAAIIMALTAISANRRNQRLMAPLNAALDQMEAERASAAEAPNEADRATYALLKSEGIPRRLNSEGYIVEVEMDRTYFRGQLLETVGKLSHLEVLWLTESQITDAELAHLQSLAQLRTLYLDNTGITDSGLAHLKALKKLASLHLGRTQITDRGVAHLVDLPELEELHVNHTSVTNASIDHFSKMPALRDLWLTGTKVVRADCIQALKPNHPEIEVEGGQF